MSAGSGEPASILGVAGVEGEFLGPERRYWLAEIIPPLVHRLNNSLLVLSAMGGFPSQFDGSLRQVQEHERLSESLSALSMFARQQASAKRPVIMSQLVRTLDCLVSNQAKERGVEWELCAPRSSQVGLGDLFRLQQWLVCLALTLVKGLAAEGGRELRTLNPALALPQLRLGVGPRRGGPGLWLSARMSHDAERAAAELLQNHREWSEEFGMRVRSRRLGPAVSFQIVLPGLGAGSPQVELSAAPFAKRKQLTLVEPDDDLRELLGEFLRGESFQVQALEGAGELSASQIEAGLLILDLDCLRWNPGLMQRLGSQRKSLDSMLLLGTPQQGELQGPWSSVTCLSKPFRPFELLDELRRLS